MSRLLFVTVLMVCLFYVFQASPVPEDTQQSTLSELENIANQLKKALSSASDTFNEKMGQWVNDTNIIDTLEKANIYLKQAAEQFRKEAEKIGDKLHD